MKAKLIKTEKGYHLDTGSFDGIHLACYPHDVTKQRLSLKNCQAIERGYDLDELIKNDYIKHSVKDDKLSLDEQIQRSGGFNVGYKEGFQKALEILGDKKFSEEDVISMIEKSRETGLTAQFLMLTKQQTEWDVEIIEFTADNLKSINNEWHKLGEPKLDADGCLILKRI